MKVTVVYTMKGCPWCQMMKEKLTTENVPFIERDINEFTEEYDEFVKLTNNEYVPALMLVTLDENDEPYDIKLMAPERDFSDIDQGVKLTKDYFLN
jgi:glutaredoxin